MSFSLRSCFQHPPLYQFILLAIFLCSVQATCYYPSGSEAVIPGSFTPCNSNPGAVSMCCNSENGDRCTKEGLCLSRSNAYYRDLCTDSTWTAPECVKVCLEDWSPQVTLCEGGSWCCGPPDNSTSCCDGGKGFKLAATAVTTSFALTPTNTGISLSSASASPTTTPAAGISSETAAPGSKASSGNKSNSVAIGAGVGVAVGVVLIFLIAGYWFWRRKQQKRKAAGLPDRLEGTGESSGPPDYREHKKPLTNMSTTQAAPSTMYERGGMEDGAVMTALATGGAEHNSSLTRTNTPLEIHSHGGGIHEMSSRDNFHELPAGDQRLGSYNSKEKF